MLLEVPAAYDALGAWRAGGLVGVQDVVFVGEEGREGAKGRHMVVDGDGGRVRVRGIRERHSPRTVASSRDIPALGGC